MLPRPAKWVAGLSLVVRSAAAIWEAHSPLPFNALLQNYSDFHAYYLVQLRSISAGLIPYRDFASSYPPLFLYLLYPFYAIAENTSAVPIVVADALVPPLIYLLARKRATEVVSIAAALGYALSPFFLIYEGFSWLSEEPMLFFLLLSLYLLQEGRWTYSSVALAVSVMLKQDALFILPAYVFLVLTRAKSKAVSSVLAPFAAVVGGVSLPFLIIAPKQYLGSLSLGRLYPGSLQPSINTAGITIGSFTSIPTSAPVPPLSCSLIGANFIAATYTCTGVGAGSSLASNYLINNSALANTVFSLLIPILILPAIVELGAVGRERLFPFSFLVSASSVIELLFFFNLLTPYKYYLAPSLALMLVCATDFPSLAVGVAAPLAILLIPYPIVYRIVPLVGVQFLAGLWIIRDRRKREASPIVGQILGNGRLDRS